MAIDQSRFEQSPVSVPLETGFEYKDSSEIPGFTIRPEVIAAVRARREVLDSRHRAALPQKAYIRPEEVPLGRQIAI